MSWIEDEVTLGYIALPNGEFSGGAKRSPLERPVRRSVTETLDALSVKAKHTERYPNLQGHRKWSETAWKIPDESVRPIVEKSLCHEAVRGSSDHLRAC